MTRISVTPAIAPAANWYWNGSASRIRPGHGKRFCTFNICSGHVGLWIRILRGRGVLSSFSGGFRRVYSLADDIYNHIEMPVSPPLTWVHKSWTEDAK